MKTFAGLILALVALTSPLFSQSAPPATLIPPAAAADSALTKFDLDFPGGTPDELSAAIQKAMRRPLNVIVPPEDASVRLPALKMKNVNVSELFQALGRASAANRMVDTGNGTTYLNTEFGFQTVEKKTDDSIWYFYNRGTVAPPPQRQARFYLLTPYLIAGLTVDDITTAIQTAWKMQGDTTPPTMSFHKETKLLIVVGAYGQLSVIDAALKALDGPPKPVAASPAKSADSPKPEH